MVDLDRRLTFRKRAVADSAIGLGVEEWADQFTVWASVRYKTGSEGVEGGRMEGRNPVVIKVRATPDTALIGREWQAVDGAETFDLFPATITKGRGFYMIDGELNG